MNLNVRLYQSYDINITLKSHFCVETLRVCHYGRCNGRLYIKLLNIMRTTGGLSILIRVVISIPDATSNVKRRNETSYVGGPYTSDHFV